MIIDLEDINDTLLDIRNAIVDLRMALQKSLEIGDSDLKESINSPPECANYEMGRIAVDEAWEKNR